MTLRDAADDSLLANATSGVNGTFRFSSLDIAALRPDLQVELFADAAWWPTTPLSLSLPNQYDQLVSAPLPVLQRVSSVGEIRGAVWLDANDDGVLQHAELPVNNVTLRVQLTDGTPVGAATTDNNGVFTVSVDQSHVDTPLHVVVADTSRLSGVLFANQLAAHPQLGFNARVDEQSNIFLTPLAGVTLSSGALSNQTAAPCDNARNVNLGVATVSTISVTSFHDVNKNGVYERVVDRHLDGIIFQLFDAQSQERVAAGVSPRAADASSTSLEPIQLLLPTDDVLIGKMFHLNV